MPVLSAKDTTEIKRPSPGPQTYWEDSKWANEHFGEIVREYPDQWVAIVNQKVAASGKTISEVERIVFKMTGSIEFPIYFAEKGIRVYKY